MGATVKDDLDGTIFAYDYMYETTFSTHHDLWTDHVTKIRPMTVVRHIVDVVCENGAHVDGWKSWHMLVAHDSCKQNRTV